MFFRRNSLTAVIVYDAFELADMLHYVYKNIRAALIPSPQTYFISYAIEGGVCLIKWKLYNASTY